jgi:hypothetical protein
MQWSKEKDIKTNNAMVKRKRHKDKQCNGQNKKTQRQTMQWSTEKDKDKQCNGQKKKTKTNNAMVKIKRHKDKQCNGQQKKT